MKKIALLRGANLNKWEMQNYEPLSRYYDLVGFTSTKSHFDTNSISFPVVRLKSIEEKIGWVPVYGGMASRNAGGKKYFPDLLKWLKNYDLVHTAETFNEYSLQAIESKRKNKDQKVVVTVWENIPFLHEDNKKRKEIKRRVCGVADAFIAITDRAKKALLLEGVPENKIHVIPMGIDINTFKPEKKNNRLMKDLGISSKDFLIVSIGRLEYEKGFSQAITAVKLLINETKHNNIKLLIVGNGPEKENLMKLIRSLRLTDNVLIKDNIPYQDIPKVHNLADIFILLSLPLPGWQEQFGMVFIEAMACGKPVISTLSGSIPEVIGNTGVLVQPADFMSAYQAMLKLYKSGKLRASLSRKARKRAEQIFDSKKVAMKIRKVYKDLLDR